jgi:hypothetical protein
MSFWKSLFGGTRSEDPATAEPAARENYKGYAIEARPYAAEGQFQTAGTISKSVDGEVKTHRFVRADRFPTREDAAAFSLIKAKQIVDQSGDRMFG